MYVCERCGKECESKRGLTLHKKIHKRGNNVSLTGDSKMDRHIGDMMKGKW